MRRKNVLLLLPLLALLSGCASDISIIDSIDVWTAKGTEKIPAFDDFSSRYGTKTLEIEAARNENEAAQIVISSSQSHSYEVVLNDLTTDEGVTLSKSHFSLYHEKMISLTAKFDYNSPLVIGDLPDALLPYEKAVEYKENVVKANENQPIWVSLKAPVDQKPGLYKGNFIVKLDKNEFVVPVRARVRDYTLDDTTYSESAFRLRENNIALYEQDTSDEMLEKYFDFMLDHRISSDLPFDFSHWSYNSDLSKYLHYLTKYTFDDRCSTIVIPYHADEKEVEIDQDGYLAIDDKRSPDKEHKRTGSIYMYNWEEFEEVLLAMVQESFKTGHDLFKKSVASGTLFDEFTNDTSSGYMALNKAVYNLRRIDDAVVNLSSAIEYAAYDGTNITLRKFIDFDEENDNGGVGYQMKDLETPISIPSSLSQEEFAALKANLKQSIYDTVCHVTCTYVPPEFFFENVNRCAICYLANLYDMGDSRARIRNMCDEKGWVSWVYTCVLPYNPYPTYHIEDCLISSRLLSWQMYDYEIVGNLFWGSAIATVVDDDLYSEQLIDQDYYQTGNRYPWANGDGFLLYPGRHYGIYGPLSSIRLESIMDGNEDYDLFHALEGYYEDRNEFDKVKGLLFDGFYEGMSINYEGEYLDRFASKRSLSLFMLECAEGQGTMITDFKEGKMTIKAKKGTDILLNDERLGHTESVDEYFVYEVPFTSRATLSSKRGNTVYSVEL